MSNNVESKVIGNPDDWINWIKESITKKQIKYYDYKHFNSIQEIGFGRFGKVYRAKWKNSHSYLAFKSFINSNILSKEIVNELKLQREINFYENIIQFYGITTESKNDNPKEYLLVMEYADSGTLRNYLNERSETLTWNDKLNLALQLANAISCLHNEEIVHRNLHPNNVLVHKNTIKLTDFGFSKQIEESFNFQSNLFKMVVYVDPQIFIIEGDNNNQIQVYLLNKKSDIYSLGIILWEISSGQLPFCKKSYDIDLAKKILQGLRENPIPNTPEDYIKIYTDCWNNEPENRPTIKQVIVGLNTIISDFQQSNNIQLSNEQQNIVEFSKNNSLHEEISQVIQYFSKINIKEIEPSMSLDTSNFSIIVNEIILLLEKTEVKRKGYEAINYLNNHNIALQEICDWLLNNQFSSNSVFLFGIFNQVGIEINVNKQKAFELYQKAANFGNIYGITSLGYCYQHGIGTSINKQKGFELYQEAANMGSLRGMYNLAVCYELGIGTDIDKQKAFKLYQKTANLGDPYGINSLGYCYEHGIGTSVNEQKAFELHQKSANLGNISAINNLGTCYYGGIGTDIDKQKAFELYQKAANLGDSFAQYNLALMYEDGEGVKKDINQAIYWYNKSAEQGNQDAEDILYLLTHES
ncbi:hypothetical protein RclHR1_04780007 [Rhizophagus clarus]|uniref:Kinase-like domain-containing protein n=1 Tax=Rhizophagus clarus TaxID=94130 RepID=A0A2Z6S0T6_9GLOM|nr:hypothetical protein RclHR1_04780007 [Rhizophagus clarus]GES87927.1 kinase-like domain-containing protein [Rhizophagus clarus]